MWIKKCMMIFDLAININLFMIRTHSKNIRVLKVKLQRYQLSNNIKLLNEPLQKS